MLVVDQNGYMLTANSQVPDLAALLGSGVFSRALLSCPMIHAPRSELKWQLVRLSLRIELPDNYKEGR